MDISQLKVDGAIFHPLPGGSTLKAKKRDAEPPPLSDEETPLDETLEEFLRDAIVRAVRDGGETVRAADQATTVVTDFVGDFVTEAVDDAIEQSAGIRARLLDVQASNSPPGLLAIIRGHAGSDRVISVLKVEEERGLSYEVVETATGRRVDVTLEDSLVLTEKTEIFKTAVFYLDATDPGDIVLAGYVTDNQLTTSRLKPVSDYWVHDFLGCEYANSEDVLTRNWIKATNGTISRYVHDPIAKDTASAALHAELGANRSTIRPMRFIRDHLPEDIQDVALQRLRDSGVPEGQFRKSRGVSDDVVRKGRTLWFSDLGVRIRIPRDYDPDLEDAGEGLTKVTITGRLSAAG